MLEIKPPMTLFSPSDLERAEQLAARLRVPTDPITSFISIRLTDFARRELEQATSLAPFQLENLLAFELNRIVLVDALEHEHSFAEFSHTPRFLRLFLKGDVRLRNVCLNKIILQRSLPQHLSASPNALGAVRGRLFRYCIVLIILSWLLVAFVRFEME